MTQEELMSKFNTIRACVDGPGECIDCEGQIDMVWDAICEACRLAEEYRNSYCSCTGGDRLNSCNLPWEEKHPFGDPGEPLAVAENDGTGSVRG